jgi:(p)ppGpp synthase/HD superfamily hydrolase
MHNLVVAARAFAMHKHASQCRKYDCSPYFEHLERVHDLLQLYKIEDPATLAAAFLHDVVEDTDATIDDMHRIFGEEVARLVYWLTDAEQGSRRERKLMAAWRLSRAPYQAKLIKLADLADNTPTIVRYDPGFAKVWLAEKHTILRLMVAEEGQPFTLHPLYKLASDDARQEERPFRPPLRLA